MSDADFKADPSIYTGEDPAAPVDPEAERPIGGITAGLAGAEQATFVAPRPLRADVWRRFRRNRLAMSSAKILLPQLGQFLDAAVPNSEVFQLTCRMTSPSHDGQRRFFQVE